MPNRGLSACRTQRGLTLVELMVSIAIGLLVISAVSYVYLGAKGSYRGNESMARIQEAGRFALDAMTRDIRRAGALGCGSFLSITNQPVAPSVFVPKGAVGDPTEMAVDGSGNPIPVYGFAPAAYSSPPPYAAPSAWVLPSNGARAPTGAVPPYYGGDILQLQIASGLPVRMSAGVDTAAGTITIASNALPNSSAANFNTGDFALLADCSSAAIFQVINTSSMSSPPVLLSYATSAGQPASSISISTFPTVQHYDQVTYYVGKRADGLPALYRYSVSGAAGAGTVEAVVDNVEDLDIQYGVGTGTGNLSMATGQFKRAGAMGAAEWAKVISIEVSVIATGDQQGVATTNQALTFHGTNWAAPDNRLRQVYSATSSLRDRLQ